MQILSLDGGGYLGLTTISFLEALEEHFKSSCHQQFTFFTGTSTGAIIALSLAAGRTAKEVATLYQELGDEVFPSPTIFRRVSRSMRTVFRAKHDNEALKGCLTRVFGDTTLADISAQGKHVLVPAYSLTNGRPRIFKTDHSANLSRDGGRCLRDIALASAAAPTYLPVVAVRDPVSGVNELYCDGGVCANNPALLAYTEAMCELRVDHVRILSISTPRTDMATRAWVLDHSNANSPNWGYVGWLTAGKLAEVFTNAAPMLAHETLRRLVRLAPGAAYERIEFENRDHIPMDLATPAATATLRQLGIDRASQNSVRDQVRSFFNEEEVIRGERAKAI